LSCSGSPTLGNACKMISGALEHLVYGKIEAPLVHFHTEVNKAVEAGMPHE